MKIKTITEMEKEINELQEQIERLEQMRVDECYGNLEIVKKRNKYFYYLCKNGEKRKYIRMENIHIAKSIAKRDYKKKMIRIASRKIKALEKFLKTYPVIEMRQVYEELHEGRKVFVEPLEESDEQFQQNWINTPNSKTNSYHFQHEFYTNNGERVRSKSEKIIADMLERKGVTYKYEKDLWLKDGRCIFPDFTLLDIVNRRDIYWEHMGKMDEPEYVEHALRKIEEYEKNDIILGKNLIVTFETINSPLDIRLVEKKIDIYLNN